MSRHGTEYPEWLRPLTVPVLQKKLITSEDIENSYTAFGDYLIRNNAAYWDGSFLVAYLDEWGLSRKEKTFLTNLEQQAFYVPWPLPAEARTTTLQIFFGELQKVWPLFTSSGSKTPGFREFINENRQVAFSAPTFFNGNEIPVEAIPILEVIAKKNLFNTHEFHDNVAAVSKNSFVNFNITRSIEKDSKWKPYIKITPVPSHEWLQKTFTKYYPVGMGAIVTSPFAMLLTMVLPPAGDPFAVAYALGGLIAGCGVMIAGMKISSYTHYELTPEGIKLLEQLKAWDAFKQSNNGDAAYTIK